MTGDRGTGAWRAGSLAIFVSILFAAWLVPGIDAARAQPAPLTIGDEPFVKTRHSIVLGSGRLDYDAVAGRLPIRDEETGTVRGYMFFTAYTASPRAGERRPLTFLWNGGPGSPSILLHSEMFGPRRIEGTRFVDNADTLLTDSDLVFLDPIGTGFSRPVSKAALDEFLNTLGDFAATAEFVRAYRARFHVEGQPLFLAGESYGTWRVGGTAELLAARGIDVAGAILISGGIPGSGMRFQFIDAMSVPARTAAAFFHHRLPRDLMADRERTIAAAERWAHDVYMPALDRLPRLSAGERERIARELARFTGLDQAMIDRATLVISNREYLRRLAGDESKPLDPLDMRNAGTPAIAPSAVGAIGHYLREELGYDTDLAYTGLEDGYAPVGQPHRVPVGERWSYNHAVLTSAVLARSAAGGGPPAAQPWLQRAMRALPRVRVFVAAGRYDSYNMCAGNRYMVVALGSLAARFTTRCYDGGHMMYAHDPGNRLLLARDVRNFVRDSSDDFSLSYSTAPNLLGPPLILPNTLSK